MWTAIFLLLLAAAATYFWVVRHYSYWERLGVPCIKPTFPFGTLKVKGQPSMHSSFVNKYYYDQMKGKAPICGTWLNIRPTALVTDINFVKTILIKDFQYFHDRGMYFNEKDDPLSAHLFNLEGERWKALRAKITPTFTSGKMKFMFPTMAKVGYELVDTLAKDSDLSRVDIKEYFARFTTDVIGSCAFGLDCNSLKDPSAEFRSMGQRHFGAPRISRLMLMLLLNCRELDRLLGIKSVRDDVREFFSGVVRKTVAHRETNHMQRNDFMNLLLKLKAEGQLTIDEVAAECFVFFLAGFETSSTASSYALYELAQNPDVQEKARQSVNEALSKHDGQFTYEAINEMDYLEQCVNESLRQYPPAANLARTVSKDYPVPEMGITLRKGTFVTVPVYAIHHDPEFYLEPDKFRPERFSAEEMAKRPACTFLPFGEGPRICIGMRFGMMQAKIGLALLLKNFKFSLHPATPRPLRIKPQSLVFTSQDDILLKVEKI